MEQKKSKTVYLIAKDTESLRKLIGSKGFDGLSLADETGISNVTISRMLGGNPVRVKTANTVTRTIGVKTEDYFFAQ